MRRPPTPALPTAILLPATREVPTQPVRGVRVSLAGDEEKERRPRPRAMLPRRLRLAVRAVRGLLLSLAVAGIAGGVGLWHWPGLRPTALAVAVSGLVVLALGWRALSGIGREGRRG